MKTYIIYTTRHGAAAFCAQQIAQQLPGEVRLLDLGEWMPAALPEADRYILGGSIYMGMAQKALKAFCGKFADGLLQKPLGLYLSCMGVEEDMVQRQMVDAFGQRLMGHAKVSVNLGGAFDFDKLGRMERFIVRQVDKAMRKQGKEGLGSLKGQVSAIAPEAIADFCVKMEG
ncbi:flavodoxin domain-containing protein [Luoshenia tenuis]|uniref:flavodoxin domain-containing protein n=1 Tax=Luoshenia tenuis TaxID=2763654 RepID=UPI003D8AA71C